MMDEEKRPCTAQGDAATGVRAATGAPQRATVTEAMARLGSLAGYGLDIHPERCVRVRNRRASCNRCAEACTSGAIAFRDDTLVITQDRCVGCGTCATVCPTCALETRHPSDADLALRADAALCASGEAHEVTFACHAAIEQRPRACAAAGAIELMCASRMEETLAVRLFARGAQRIRLVHGACAGCPRENGIESARLVARTLDEIERAWGLDCSLSLVDVGELAGDEPAGRTDAPGEAAGVDGTAGAGEAATAAGEGAPSPAARAYVQLPDEPGARTVAAGGEVRASYKPVHVMADGTLPHFVPTRRHKLLDALATFGEPVTDTLDTRLWGHVSIDRAKCRSCKMCAVFCPTGALQKFADEGGRSGVEHYVAECVHCGLCQDICPDDAIVSSTAVPARQLADGATERYVMPDPAWWTGPDQILRKMQPQISGREVRHSY